MVTKDLQATLVVFRGATFFVGILIRFLFPLRKLPLVFESAFEGIGSNDKEVEPLHPYGRR